MTTTMRNEYTLNDLLETLGQRPSVTIINGIVSRVRVTVLYGRPETTRS